MTTPLPLGLAPYISPLTLMTAPTGIDWSTIGEPTADPTPAQNMAEIWNMAAGPRRGRTATRTRRSGRPSTSSWCTALTTGLRSARPRVAASRPPTGG